MRLAFLFVVVGTTVFAQGAPATFKSAEALAAALKTEVRWLDPGTPK